MLPALAAAGAVVAVAFASGCGSAAPATGTLTPGTTPTPSPTSLFPSGGIISGAPSGTPGGPGKPVLTITQLGLQMTFSGQLGTVTYSIDSSQNGSKQDQSGTPFTVDATIDLATARYTAMACAGDSPIEATITVFTTSASSLKLNGPTAWVRAGSHLLGFTAGQSSCALGEQTSEIPLLQQMMQSATSQTGGVAGG